jgi:hypothetical protein
MSKHHHFWTFFGVCVAITLIKIGFWQGQLVPIQPLDKAYEAQNIFDHALITNWYVVGDNDETTKTVMSGKDESYLALGHVMNDFGRLVIVKPNGKCERVIKFPLPVRGSFVILQGGFTNGKSATDQSIPVIDFHSK